MVRFRWVTLFCLGVLLGAGAYTGIVVLLVFWLAVELLNAIAMGDKK